MTVQSLLYPCLSVVYPLTLGRLMFEHRIDDRQQLAHTGHDGCPIEGGTHLRASSRDRLLPPQRAAIPIE
jgi:hypothetical protein